MLGGTKREVTVEVKQRTLSIGGQIYQMRNIARVQNLEFRPDRRKILARMFGRALAVVGAMALVTVAFGREEDLEGPLLVFNMIGIGVILVLIGTDLYAASRRSRFVLLLETTGSPFIVLVSKRFAAVQKVVDLVADVLENPPVVPRIMHFGDVVMGDKLKQVGDHNIGKLVDG